GKDHGDPNRMRYDDGLYFKNHLEIAEAFPGRPDVLENTLRIADEVDLRFEKKYHVPRFPTETEGFTSEDEMLRAWVWSGARDRYGAAESGALEGPTGDATEAATASDVPPEIAERVEYEIGVITK